MAELPVKNSTIDLVDSFNYGGKPRPYLGMSGIGDGCPRKLWYGFHWVNIIKHKARTERIFSIGHMFEQIAIADLKNAGCYVFAFDNEGNEFELTGVPGETQEELTGFAGHFVGHPDGRIIGLQEDEDQDEEYLLELKTMKQEKFKAFVKHGVKSSNPVYYSQSIMYMGEMKLDNCFFLVINKNTCEYAYQFIPFIETEYEDLKRKAESVLIAETPPDKAYSSNNYNCNWCDYAFNCHGHKEPDQNCRTCNYCDIENNGIFKCGKNGKKITVTKQRKGCEHWSKGWGL